MVCMKCGSVIECNAVDIWYEDDYIYKDYCCDNCGAIMRETYGTMYIDNEIVKQ